MNRLKWLSARWPSRVRTIGEKLKGFRASNESPDGFIIDRIRDDLVEGRFFQRFVIAEASENPFGSREIFERIRYRIADFALYAEFPGIELRNSSRGVQDFANRLLEACDFDLTISPIIANPLSWIGELQKIMGEKLVVDSIQISGITFEQGISGKVLLHGDRDVRSASNQLVGDRSHLIEKAQFKLKTTPKPACIQLSSNASAKLSSDCTSAMLPFLRKSLREAASNTDR